jgi:hypothetical protein
MHTYTRDEEGNLMQMHREGDVTTEAETGVMGPQEKKQNGSHQELEKSRLSPPEKVTEPVRQQGPANISISTSI